MTPRLPVNWIAAVLLGALLLIQTVRIEGLRIWPLSIKGLNVEKTELLEKLHEISNKKNAQGKTTERTITETKIIYRDAEKVAERIEKAPTAPDCKTPGEIMGADL